MSTGNENQPTKAELEIAGAANLAWLEKQNLKLMGLDVFKIFAYELVQMLNHVYLTERLRDETTQS